MELKKQYTFPTVHIDAGDEVQVIVHVTNRRTGKNDTVRSEPTNIPPGKWNSLKEYSGDEAHGLDSAYVVVLGKKPPMPKEITAKLG